MFRRRDAWDDDEDVGQFLSRLEDELGGGFDDADVARWSGRRRYGSRLTISLMLVGAIVILVIGGALIQVLSKRLALVEKAPLSGDVMTVETTAVNLTVDAGVALPATAESVTPTTVRATSVTPQPGLITAPNDPQQATLLSEELVAELQAYMVHLVNEARRNANLPLVSWDAFAATVGAQHAQDMVAKNYFSHWNSDGLGPDHRYSQAGGQHAVMENLSAYSSVFEDGTGAPISDWFGVVRTLHEGLMNSPGHRANILHEGHTHVGVGMAYDPLTGQMRLAQLFSAHYVRLNEPLPSQAELGAQIPISGQVDGTVNGDIFLGLAYEPLPAPITIEQLAQTSTYQSLAENVDAFRLDRVFDTVVTLPRNGKVGFYHIRIFGDVRGVQALMVDHVIYVAP